MDQSSRWQFGQCFGEREGDVEDFSEADVLSVVEFDRTGEFLATGDKGGRVVLFERVDPGKGKKRRRAPAGGRRSGWLVAAGGARGGGARGGGARDDRMAVDGDDNDAGGGGGEDDYEDDEPGLGDAPPPEFRFYTEFQSHESEFDYLKSLEIEERINKIAWCERGSNALHLLSTNDKTIKLWRVGERAVRAPAGLNVEAGRYGGHLPVAALRVPRLTPAEPQMTATARRIFSNAHAYHINSVSVNSDGATFLSADDLRINVWSLDNARLSFNVVDIKPPSLEELNEVITTAIFHPHECSTFLFSTSRGAVKLGDMRDAALCDRSAKVFEQSDEGVGESYYGEIVANVTGVDFSRDGRYIVSRDYLRVKVWDSCMDGRGPLLTIPVQEYLRPRLPELYESDAIFDKFGVGLSPAGTTVLTGTYGNTFRLYDFRLAPSPDGADGLGFRAAVAAAAVDELAGGGGGGGARGGRGGGGGGVGGFPLARRFATVSAVPGVETSIELCKMARPTPPVLRRIPPMPPAAAYDAAAEAAAAAASGGMLVDAGPGGGALAGDAGAALRPPPGTDVSSLDLSRKVLHYSFHPTDDVVAVAGLNNLYIYYAR